MDINSLIQEEKNHRKNNKENESLETCIKILNIIQTEEADHQYKTISNVLLHETQFLSTIIGLYNYMISKEIIINSENTGKYFQLLVNALSKSKDKNSYYSAEKNEILKQFKEKNFDNIKSVLLGSLQNQKYAKTSTSSGTFNSSVDLASSNSKGNYMALTDQSLIGHNSMNSNVSDSQGDSFESKSKEPQRKAPNKSQNTTYKPNLSLPYVFATITATLSSNQVLDVVEKNFNKLHFKKIYTIKNNAIENVSVFEYRTKNCLKKIFCKKVNAIQLHVSVSFQNGFSNDKYERKIIIKSIIGNEEKISKRIIRFLKRISASINSFRLLKQSKNFSSISLEQIVLEGIKNSQTQLRKSKGIPTSKDYTVDFSNANEKSLIEFSNDEAGKYYNIYKILSKENYELGKNLSEYIQNFITKYSNISIDDLNSISTRSIMEEIVKQIDDCTGTFKNSFNNNSMNTIGSNELANLNQKTFVRQGCEQFIFNKIYFVLFRLYEIKYAKENEVFKKKQKFLKDHFSIDQLFEQLEIKKKFRGTEFIPYNVSISLINKIEYEQTPQKKFENLSLANLEMRNSILGYSKGKSELDSMDDELPIMIYIATQVNINNLPAELYLIDDYLKCMMKDDLIQNKTLTNLQSAVLYISKNWDNKEN